MILNQQNFKLLPDSVLRPRYERAALQPAIVHIGVGGFHRSHQAFYLDQLLQQGLTDWGIVGMGLRPADALMTAKLKAQDCLYTLMIKQPDGAVEPHVIGSVIDCIYAPENPLSAIKRLANPQTHIVSLTITEGGYNFDQNGEFIDTEPDVIWDMIHNQSPKTVFGLLANALRMRRDAGLQPFTVLSCDNIQHNGDVARKMLLSFVSITDAPLAEWIDSNVSFPNCMVDRITPVTQPSDIQYLKETVGIEDAVPVVCEPFLQWVLEDRFPAGRPAWEEAGVQFVSDVTPYEKMKLRLLNAGHSFLGFAGSLCGYETIDEAVSDPLLRSALRAFMDEEATPSLDPVVSIDLTEYKDSLLQRFGNPAIRDLLARICSESSAKIPKFLLPTVEYSLANGGSLHYGAFMIAAWYCLLAKGFAIQDNMQAVLRAAIASPVDFLRLESIFGELSHSERFVNVYTDMAQSIQTQGVKETLQSCRKQ